MKVLNIAHRGARSLAPENTLAAARRGLELGADLWETDLAVTKDGELILMHDDSLARTTDVERRFPARARDPFTTFTLEEIRTLDAGSWFGGKDPHGQIAAGAVSERDLAGFRGEKVPTLEEALLFTKKAGWALNLELKRLPAPLERFPVPERVLAMIERLKMDPARIVLSSGNHAWLDEAKRLRPDIEVQALVGLFTSEPMDWGAMRFKTYNVRHTRVSEDEVRDLAGRGFTVNLYTVNEPADMRRFIAAGAAGLITDFPQVLKALR